MKKTLTVIALAGSLLFSSTANTPESETSNLRPHKQVQKYLDESGVAKEEFRNEHYIFVDGSGVPHYNRSYILDGEQFIEQYDMTDIIRSHRNGKSFMFSAYPSAFKFKGIWYADIFRDGFNGNEIKGSDLIESLEKTPAKCNSNERGFCI